MRFLTLATSLALLSTPSVWGSEIVPDLSYSRLFGPNAAAVPVHILDAASSTSAATSASDPWTAGYGLNTNNVVASVQGLNLPLPPHTQETFVPVLAPWGQNQTVAVPLPAGEIFSTDKIFGPYQTGPLLTIPLSSAKKRNPISRKYNNTAFTSVDQFPKVGAGLLNTIDIFDDEFFGIMRLNGPNPTLIRKINANQGGISPKFGDIATLRQKYPIDTLLNDGQLYELDYVQLAGVVGTPLAAPDNSILQYPQNPNPGAQQRYITAPYVLLSHVTEQGVSKIVPIAIQLGQTYVAGSTAILYRADYKDKYGVPLPGAAQNDWKYALTIVNAADSVIHELDAHLVKTHLIEENIIIGTHVKLPQNHVISRLLIGEGHSLKTLQLNEDARNSLLPGVVDEVFAGGYIQAGPLVDEWFASFNYQNDYVPRDLSLRGFDNLANQFEQDGCSKPDGTDRYYYARDAVHTWNILHDFVDSVLSTQYHSNKAVAKDQALQAWAAYLSTPQFSFSTPQFPLLSALPPVAPVPGFPSNFTTRTALTDAVTSALYKATVGHSVVNYPQTFYNAYIPVYPALALYQPILTASTVGTGITTDAYIASALGNANTQEVMTILANGLGQPVAASGLVDDITLLQYATNAAAKQPAAGDDIGVAIQEGAQDLLTDLTRLQNYIENRDATVAKQGLNHYQYGYFDPSRVANSIFA